MSVAVAALLLARLDARMGRWCPVAELARHLGLAEAAIGSQLEQLQRMPCVGLVLLFDEWGYVACAQIAPAWLH